MTKEEIKEKNKEGIFCTYEDNYCPQCGSKIDTVDKEVGGGYNIIVSCLCQEDTYLMTQE